MFDRFVSGARPSWRRRGVLIGSLALHGVAGVALLITSFFRVAEIAPPPLAILFVSAPPPSGGERTANPAPAKRPRARTRPVAPHTAVVQPAPAPDHAPAAPADSSPSDGNGGGGPGAPGAGPGTPGGTGSDPVAPMAAPRPVNVPPHKLDAQRISGSDPHLPPPMIRQHAGERGLTFMARLCVDQSGRVAQINVVQSLPGADADIVTALRRWRYQPQPIPVCFMANFVFDVDVLR